MSKTSFLCTTALMALAGSVSLLAGPSSISLTGTVRDFTPATNPDFEYTIADDRGVLDTVLPASKNPVYLPASSPTIHSAATFDQWYNDVPGVNIPLSHSITLDETFAGSGIYSYESASFFPIDGLGFGDYGAFGHNYHFTYELHTSFTYKPGQTFDFYGDDDLWVYINGKLAIDLGGVHGSQSASVDLTAEAAALGLVDGETYDFDLYFAERHTVASNFKIETSIELRDTQPLPEAQAMAPSALALGALAFGAWRRRKANA